MWLTPGLVACDDLQGAQRLVCGAFDERACGDDLLEVVDGFLVVDLAGRDGGDPRGVGGDELCAHASDRVARFDVFGRREERVARQRCLLGSQLRAGRQRSDFGVFSGAALLADQVAERSYQTIDLRLAVREGYCWHELTAVWDVAYADGRDGR
jgi:hypothetical protein